MKKLLLLFAIAMLALISCTKGDEPSPEPVGDTTLYMAANGLTGFPEAIYDLQGHIIYQCPDETYSIMSLTSEGSDWYAVLKTDGGIFSVVKNGKTIYTTPEVIWSMAVEHGIVYTVQENKSDNTFWVNRGFERLYEVPSHVNYYTISVHGGAVVFTVNNMKPYTWWNGVIVEFEGLDEGFGYTYGISRTDDDALYVYQGYLSGKYKYIWNDIKSELPEKFVPTSSYIVNGHAFILGEKIISQGVGGFEGLPAVLIDGIETVLNNDHPGYRAVSLASHGVDTYILVNNSAGAPSLVYKNLQPINLPDVTTPYSVTPYGSDDYTGKSNLSMLGIKAIATVENDR